MWTGSMLAAVSAIVARGITRADVPVLVGSLAGWAGIMVVLCQATEGLETRQNDQRKGNAIYETWKIKSWKGLGLPGGL